MENTQIPNKRNTVIVIISIVVLIVLSLAGFLFVKYFKDKTKINVVEAPKKAVELYGTLLVSMVPNDVKEGMPLVYSIEASSTIVTPLYQQLMKTDELFISQLSLSPNRKFFITGGMPTSASAKDAGSQLSLYTNTIDKGFRDLKPENIVAKFGSSPESKGVTFRNPSIGSHGGVLYTVPPKDSKDVNFDWEIHYAALGEDIRVAFGLQPKWVSPNQFVYVSSGAIRLHDLLTGADSIVDVLAGVDGKVISIKPHMTLGVSPDGKMLAFSNPDALMIFLFEKEGDRFIQKKSIKAHGFWPTFSPRGDILAVQTVREISTQRINSEPAIVFYDLTKDVPEVLKTRADLSNYNNNLLFINDWY